MGWVFGWRVSRGRGEIKKKLKYTLFARLHAATEPQYLEGDEAGCTRRWRQLRGVGRYAARRGRYAAQRGRYAAKGGRYAAKSQSYQGRTLTPRIAAWVCNGRRETQREVT